MNPLAIAVDNAILVPQDLPIVFDEQTAEEQEFAKRDGCVWRTVNGRRVCIKPKGTSAERAQRALDTHKPMTKAKWATGQRGADGVVNMLGGRHTGNMDAVDVIVSRGGKIHGTEVKTFVDQRNDKVTMHPSSRRRKESWARRNKAELHTVVVDSRTGRYYSGNKVYYRRGVGSFRLSTMTPVRSADHLKQLMTEKV